MSIWVAILIGIVVGILGGLFGPALIFLICAVKNRRYR